MEPDALSLPGVVPLLIGPVAHLFRPGDGWHVVDLALYAVSGAGLLAGIALFRRGRSERAPVSSASPSIRRAPGVPRPPAAHRGHRRDHRRVRAGPGRHPPPEERERGARNRRAP